MTDPLDVLGSLDIAGALDYASRVSTIPTGDIYRALVEQDAKLVAHGFPPLSPFWLDSYRQFYAHPTAYRAVFRVGRRGGKSSSAVRVAVAEVLHGAWVIPPGDTGVFVFLSTTTGEAEERLKTAVQILEALGLHEGVDFHEGQDKRSRYVQLLDRPIVLRALPASFRTAVGFTCIGFVADELARWRDERTGRNPASFVLSSIRPAMLTQIPHGAHELMISSPWSELDAHFDAFSQGTTSKQVAIHGETWVANPTRTEEECRMLAAAEAESGENVDFDREYRAIPMPASEEAFFDSRAIEDAVEAYALPVPAPIGSRVTAGADFGFAHDHSAIAVCARLGDRYKLIASRELAPSGDERLKPSEVVRTFADTMRAAGARVVMADKHYRESILELLTEHELALHDAPEDVAAPFVRFKALLGEGKITLPANQALLRDMRETRARPTRNGRITIILPRRVGGSHADLFSAIVLATWQQGGKKARETPEEMSNAEKEEREAFERVRARVTHSDDDLSVSPSQDLLYDESAFPC